MADSSRENYLRMGLVMEDFVYDEKNNLDGVSDQTPLSLQRRARYHCDRFGIYSQGRWSRGFKRRYPNQELSPELTAHNQKINNAEFKFYFFPSEQTLLNLNLTHYKFDEQKQFVDRDYNYA